MNEETGMRAPSDGFDCNPEDGQSTLIFVDEKSLYYGEVENCLPKQEGEAIIWTKKNY